jgi:hypothetical protein
MKIEVSNGAIEVLADPQYEIIADAINDRNGYLVARRK